MIRFILSALIWLAVVLVCGLLMFAFGMSDNNPRTPWGAMAGVILLGVILIAFVEFSPYLMRLW